MIDLLEGYIDKISASATQAVSNGGPLSEFSNSLAVLVDTVDVQAKDIKSLYQQIDALKNKGTPNSSSKTNSGGNMTGNMFPYCAAVIHSAPYKKVSCYFGPKKIIERREWACNFMDEKGVACKDNDLRRGIAEIVVHRNSISENLSYDAILRCSPPLFLYLLS